MEWTHIEVPRITINSYSKLIAMITTDGRVGIYDTETRDRITIIEPDDDGDPIPVSTIWVQLGEAFHPVSF